MIKIESTKKTSSIFLAVVLVLGTFAVTSPSFMLGNVQAQRDYGMDSSYDKKPYGNSYEQDYGMDSSYDKKPYGNSYEQDYGMDSYDKKPYGNSYGQEDTYDKKRYENTYGNSYGQDYQSYKPVYKKDSYGKDRDYDKSKDSIKSVSINKLKCINTNININGNNTGDINIGNKGKVGAEEGKYSGAYSSGGGYTGGEGYDKKQDKGFECIINNNNNNTNIITDGGNQTIPPEQRSTLNVTKEVACEDERNGASTLSVQQAAVLTCERILAEITPSDFSIQVAGNNPVPPSFNGLLTGTQVAIGPGGYTLTETPNAQVTALLSNPIVDLTTTFEGGCAPLGTGTIETGVPETCNIINTFTIEEEVDVRTTLNVTKTVVCTDPIGAIGCGNINPSNFTIQVTGNNPIPNSFAGLLTGTQVAIGTGAYNVTETPPTVPAGFTLATTFTGGCIKDPDPAKPFTATGTIDAGVPETCNITNTFTIGGGATGPLMVQGTADSHELTAMEKITKLKTQWLNELP